MSEKILIIQTAFLGDLILSTPFFHVVRENYPDAEIHVLVNAGTEGILQGNPDLDRVLVLEKKKVKKNPLAFLQFGLQLRKKGYSLIFAPHFSFRSTILSYLTGAKTRLGYKESGFSFLHTKTVSRPKLGPHEVDKLFSLLLDPAVYPEGRERRPRLYPSAPDIEKVQAKQKEWNLLHHGYILIAPSSLWETKRMPEEKFVSLVTHILRSRKEQVILIGSKADLEIEANVFRLMQTEPLSHKKRSKLLSLIGKTSLGELMVWIRDAKLLVSNDSSPVHFASAFNIPTILVYGATIPQFGYSSLSERHKIMEVRGLSCRPCGIHGGRHCPQSHFRCMMDQNPLQMYKAIEDLIPK